MFAYYKNFVVVKERELLYTSLPSCYVIAVISSSGSRTNRSPAEWAKSLNDEVLATALLDRLLYKCELIQLSGGSYRMKNRKTIFAEKES